MSQARGTRIVFLDEPERQRINPGMMMQFTGGDSFCARSLMNNPFISSRIRPSYGKQSNSGA